jgi:hypothetical protein
MGQRKVKGVSPKHGGFRQSRSIKIEINSSRDVEMSFKIFQSFLDCRDSVMNIIDGDFCN